MEYTALFSIKLYLQIFYHTYSVKSKLDEIIGFKEILKNQLFELLNTFPLNFFFLSTLVFGISMLVIRKPAYKYMENG